MQTSFLKRFILSTIGVLFISVAVTVFRFANIGTDPYSCFSLGIAGITGLSFGNAQLACNIVLTILLIIPGLKFFGIGTLTSMILIGYVSDFLLSLITYKSSELPMVIRILLVCVGILITSMGISLYSSAKLGISQYDAISFTITEFGKGKFKLSIVRIAVDIILILCGYLLGSVVGIGSILIAGGVGPVVGYLIPHVTDPLMK
ncbi:MAG: hypothetical protein E7256_11930 [Lachnospiraceae bacterium]|nr:hypothetical protein [Lachnospiraceae bacterium]